MKLFRRWRRAWERGKPSFMRLIGAQPAKTVKARIELSQQALPNVPDLRRAAIAVSVALGVMSTAIPGYALPSDGNITAGQGTIAQNGSTTTVTQNTGKLAINWQSFDIQKGEKVQFLQPNAQAVALNRVIGNNASKIYGQLSANGKVFLINPNGILFAPTAQVNVGGIVASSLQLSDANFLNGQYVFTKEGTAGAVINQGSILAAEGGYVGLLGGKAANEGVIAANKGSVVLGAGSQATLDFTGDGLINLSVSQAALDAQVANSNLIQADGGMVVMTAKAAGDLTGSVINNSGIIRAQAMTERNGKIILDGGSYGAVDVKGTLDASGLAVGQTGGTVKVLGDNVSLAGKTLVDVSGAQGGGTALIGGNFQGKGPESNAQNVMISKDSMIKADALNSGNGGRVVAWSDGTTRFDGNISAQGGVNGGDGGQVEVSGKQYLKYNGLTNTLAPKGKTGSLLLDPQDYIIGAGGDITGAALSTQLDNSNVTIISGNGTTSGNGDITVNDAVSWSGSNSLTMKAERNINANANIAASGDKANITLAADSDADGNGTVIFNSGITASAKNAATGGYVKIMYNPVSYSSPTDYSGQMSAYSGHATAYMLINNLNDLQTVSNTNTLWNKNFALGQDIDATETKNWNWNSSRGCYEGFTPIGKAFGYYTGKFDGQGYTIDNLYINKNLKSEIGLFGATNNATIENLGVTNVNITNISGSNTGGLVGYAVGNSSISNSYTTGEVNTTPSGTQSGGLVGSLQGSTISNSYSLVNVSGGGTYAGGLVGIGGGGSSIINCFAAGKVIGSYHPGLAGMLVGTVTNSSWDIEASGSSYSTGGGTGKTTSEMKTASTFAGWDPSVWNLQDGSYPTLKWQKLSFNGTLSNHASGQPIYLVYNGNILASTTSNATGSYKLTIAPSSVGDDGFLIFLGNATGSNETAKLVNKNAGAGNYDLTVGRLDVIDGSTNALIFAKGGYTNAAIPYTVSGSDISLTNGVSLYTTGSFTISGNIMTTNAGQLYNGPVVIDAGALVSAINSGAIRFGDTLISTNVPVTIDSSGAGGGIYLDGAVYTAGQALTLTTGGNNDITANNDNNAIDRINFNGANVNIKNSTELTITNANHANAANIFAGGNLTLDGGASVSSASSTILRTEDHFINNAGANALVNTGNWHIYSTTPIGDQRGGLTYDFKQYNTTYGQNVLGAGNGFVYSYAPQVTVGLIGNVTKTYDGNQAALLAADNLSVIGAIDGDTVTVTSASANYDTKNYGSNKSITANGLTISNATNNGVSVYGYSLTSNSASGAVGQIDKASLTLSAVASTKTYDGNNSASATPQVSGLQGNDSVSNLSQAYQNKNAGTGKTLEIVNGYTINDGNNGANYTVTTVGNSQGEITPLALTITGLTASNKVYNGLLDAMVNGNAGLSGLLGDDEVGVSGVAVGSFITKDVGNNKAIKINGLTLSGQDAGNYTIGNASATANITPKALTMSGITASNKVYNGGTDAILAGTASLTNGGLADGDGKYITGDTVNVSGTANGSFTDKNVGNGKTVTIGGLTLSGTDAANYTLNNYSTTGNITPKALTMSGVTVSNRVYNGGTDATLAGTAVLMGGGTIDNDGKFITGDAVNVSGTANGSFTDKNVGNGKTVTIGGLTLSGTDAGNYTLNNYSTTGNITPKALTMSGITAGNRVYNGGTEATLAGTASLSDGGLLDGDGKYITGDAVNVSGTANGNFTDKNVGNGKTVTIGGLTLSGTDASNYMLNNYSTTGNITPKALSMSGIAASNRVYNGGTDATLAGTAVLMGNGSTDGDGKYITGDAVDVSGTATGSFTDKNVGNGKTVSISGLTLSGTDAGNYVLNNYSTTGNITPKALTMSGITAGNRIYNGGTDATLTGTTALTGGGAAESDGKYITGDAVNVSGTATGSFTDKNVGNGKTVTIGGLTLSGTDASNYTLNNITTANITPKALTMSGITAGNKAYNGGIDATIAGTAVLAGGGLADGDGKYITGDAVNVGGTATGSFIDKNVGNGKTVTIVGLTLSGTDAGNYMLNNYSTTGNITPKALTMSGITAGNRVYNGGTDATLAGTASLSDGGLLDGDGKYITGDAVNVSGTATGSFTDKNVGNGKTVTIGGLTLSGTDASNYSLNNTTTANITPKTLTMSGITAGNKVYNGGTDATLAGTAVLSGGGLAEGDGKYITGDAVNVSGTANGSFADKNVGNGKTVTIGGLTLSGTDAGNYTLNNYSTTGNITPKALTMSGITAGNRVYNGGTDATLAGTASLSDGGLLDGDGKYITGDAVNVSGTANGNFIDKNVGNGKTVTIGGLTLSGTDVSNYMLNNYSTTGNITPKALSMSGIAASNRVYNGGTDATLAGTAVLMGNGSTDGDGKYITGDAVNVNGTATGSFTDKNVGNGKTVTIGGLTLSGLDASNYSLNNTTTANITPKSLTASLTGTVSKIHDGTAIAKLADNNYSFSGVLDSDAVALNNPKSGIYDNAQTGTNKTVTVNGLALVGSDAGNYQLSATSVSGPVGTITEADIYKPKPQTNTPTPVMPDNNPHIQVNQGGVVLPTEVTVSSGSPAPAGFSLTTAGSSGQNYMVDISGNNLTIKLAGSTNAGSTAAEVKGNIALLSVNNAGVQTNAYYKVAAGNGSLTLAADNSAEASIPSEPVATAASANFSLATAGGQVAEFKVIYDNGALSIHPLNEAASSMTTKSGESKKLVAATGMIAAQENLGANFQAVTAIYVHE